MNKKWQTNVDNYTLRVKELTSIKKLLKSGKNSKALAELIHYQEKYPQDTFGSYLLAQAYVNNEQISEAKAIFRKISESNAPNRYSALVEIAKLAEMEEDFKTAKKCYQTVVDQSPYDEWYAELSLVRLEKEQGNYEKAVEILREITTVSPEVIALELAKIKRAQKDLIGASLLLNTIEVQDHSDFDRAVYLEQGLMEKEFDAYDTAQMFFQQAQQGEERDKIYWKALYEEALLLYQKQDYKKSWELCKKLLEAPTELKGKIALLQGKLFLTEEYYQDAQECFEKAFEKGGSRVRRESAVYLGNFALDSGNFEIAKRNYQIATKNEEIFIREVYHHLLAIAIKEENYLAAYKYIERIKKYNEKDKNMRVAELYVEKKLGRLQGKVSFDYIGQQIIDYDSDMALEHIKNEKKDRLFADDISIERVFSTISSNLPKESQVFREVLDVYDIHYPGIGYVDGSPTNTLRVVAIPHTTNILTMYPFANHDVRNKTIVLKQKSKKKIKK